MEIFNLLEHPVWVFDFRRGFIWWSNDAGVKLWNADSLESLMTRSFGPMSDTAQRRLEEHSHQLETAVPFVHDSWTFYITEQGPVQVCLTMSHFLIEDNSEDNPEGSRRAFLVEAELPKTQHVLSDSSKRAAEIMRYQPLPVCMFSTEGYVIQQNSESVHVFGGKEEYSRAEIQKARSTRCSREQTEAQCQKEGTETDACNEHKEGYCLLSRFVNPVEGKRALDCVLKDGQQDYTAREVQQHTKNGIRWFTIQMRKAMDPVKGVPIVLYNARDITDLVEARRLAVKYAEAKRKADLASEAKSEFFAIMAHEMRTPLHQVLGFLELLLRPSNRDLESHSNDNLNSKQRDYLNLIEKSASALMSVIDDLLDFSKLEAGKMKMERIPMDPMEVALQSFQLTAPKAQQKGLNFKHNLDSHGVVPKVLGDPTRIRQVLFNFLQNAIKFTSHGFVLLEMRPTHKDSSKNVVLEFSVEDSGIGVEPQHQDIIFNKYQQADTSTSRTFGGTGLGLAICRNIVKTLEGEIGVESVVGQGSRFWFRITFETVSHPVKMPPPRVHPIAATTDKALHVLVAEDNKINQKLVVALLRRLGHSSLVVENGQLAVNAVRSQDFDLVLMDIQMPVMDGLEASRQIRKLSSQLPIVGLSADFSIDHLPKYKASGMNCCLGKPIRIKDLKHRLEAECR